MQTSVTRYVGWVSAGITLVWQLTFVAGSFALATWLWPPGLLETPLGDLPLSNAIRAVVSVAFLSVGITSIYLVLVVPFVRSYGELFIRHHGYHHTASPRDRGGTKPTTR